MTPMVTPVNEMEGQIIDDKEEWIGVKVTDNNGVEHKIAVEFDGEIRGHGQDGYPDKAAERTPEANEYVEQARKFAQYYVFMERGYDTVRPKRLHPVRLNLVRHAISEMDLDEFEDCFGDLYQQLQSHYGDAEKVIPTPSDSQNERFHFYRKEVYLGLDPLDTDFADEARNLAERYGLDIDANSPKETTLGSLSPDALDAWSAFSQGLFENADEGETLDLLQGVYVDGTSELHMAYLDHDGREQITTAMTPEVEPDALLELPVADPRSLEHFKRAVEWTLICQVRDCFIRMGVEPPEEFQVLGMGTIEAFEAYETVEFYPMYHEVEGEDSLHEDLGSTYFGDDSILGNVRSLLG